MVGVTVASIASGRSLVWRTAILARRRIARLWRYAMSWRCARSSTASARIRFTALAALMATTGLVLVAEPAMAVPGRVLVSMTTVSDSSLWKQVSAECPAGKVILGGGGDITGGNHSVRIYWSDPYWSGAPNATHIWLVRAREDNWGYAGNWSLTAWAICGDQPAGYQIVHYDHQGSITYSSVVAPCPAGKKVIGAGAYSTDGWVLDSVQPNSSLTSVTAEVYRDETTPHVPEPVWVVAAAICVNPLPGQQRVVSASAWDSSSLKQATAVCPAGTMTHSTTGSIATGNGEAYLDSMTPVNLNGSGTLVDAREDSTGYSGNWSVTATAICAA
jgi:hypothetical protein